MATNNSYVDDGGVATNNGTAANNGAPANNSYVDDGGAATDNGTAANNGAVLPEPGQLTAGEWRDLDDWPFWLSLLEDHPSFMAMPAAVPSAAAGCSSSRRSATPTRSRVS